MEIATVDIDLGKTVFHLVGLNAAGETVVRKRFSRAQLLRFTGNLKVGLIGHADATPINASDGTGSLAAREDDAERTCNVMSSIAEGS